MQINFLNLFYDLKFYKMFVLKHWMMYFIIHCIATFARSFDVAYNIQFSTINIFYTSKMHTISFKSNLLRKQTPLLGITEKKYCETAEAAKC